MRTQLTLTVTVDHSVDYDPSSHFVWYFSDDTPEPVTVEVSEEWINVDDWETPWNYVEISESELGGTQLEFHP